MLHKIVIHPTKNQNIGMMAAQCSLHNLEIITSTFGATKASTNNSTTNDGQIACHVHQILTTDTTRHDINETRLKDLKFLRFMTTPKQQTCGNELGSRNDTRRQYNETAFQRNNNPMGRHQHSTTSPTRHDKPNETRQAQRDTTSPTRHDKPNESHIHIEKKRSHNCQNSWS